MLHSCYRQGSIKTIRAQWVYGSRPSQTANCLRVRDRKWGAGGDNGRLATVSEKLVIYANMVYLNIYLLFHFYNKLKNII